MKTLFASLAAGAALGLAATPAAAQDFPNKPVTFVVPFAAGGPTDIVARSLAAAMEKPLGGPAIIVENKPGAGGTIGAADVARAQPDGYRLLVHHIGMSTQPTLYRKLPYDSIKDFQPITLINDVPMTIVTKADFPAKDFKELVSYVQKNADKITLANAGIGAASHLCGLMFMSAVDRQLTPVPYKGTAPALTDLMGGQVDLMCDQTTNTTQQIKSGKIKAYAVTSAERLDTFPDVPTAKESGLPTLQIGIWHALYAPKGTPKAVVDKLVSAAQAALADPGLQKRFAELGAVMYPKDKQTPEAVATKLKAEIEQWAPVIKKAGVYAD
jgi:tripartite-type tricarboxylate transporter receptor subunit TctC